MTKFLTLLCLLWSSIAFSQIVPPTTANQVYDQNIGAVQFLFGGRQLSSPLSFMESDTTFTLLFDDLMEDARDFNYTIVHCTDDWRLSDLRQDEYLRGFDDEEIRDFEYSANTHFDYVNYTLELPNERISWKISGNYVLYVYIEDSQNPILTQRFTILDTDLKIQGNILKAMQPAQMRTHQKISFNLSHPQLKIDDPMDEITAYVIQNGNWNTVQKARVRSTAHDVIRFDYPNDLIFPGGFEYRQVDLRSTSSRLRNILYFEQDAEGFRAVIKPDQIRQEDYFKSYSDINGKFVIGSFDLSAAELERQSSRIDYVKAVFTLEMPLSSDNIHLLGDFNDWNADQNNKMIYFEDINAYQLEVLLKKGFYEYKYVAAEPGDPPGKYVSLDLDNFRTRNTYEIFVYQKRFNDRYHKPIGYLKMEEK